MQSPLRVRSPVQTLALGAFLWLLPLLAALPAGSEPNAAGVAAPRALVVKIHADWCGTCQLLRGTWHTLQRDLAGRARFVILDVTNRDAVAASRQRAQALGILGFFNAAKARTGTVAIFDAQTRKPVVIYQGELDAAPYEAAVARLEAGSGT